VARAGVTLTPGLKYDVMDPTEFAGQSLNPRQLFVNGAGTNPAGGVLFAPLRLPVGAALREVTLSYLNTTAGFNLILFKMTPGASHATVGSLALPPGAGGQTATMNVAEPTTDGSFTYMVDVFTMTAARRIQGLRVGYVPPPQAFVPNNPVPRVLDTRITGGKLQNNEERVVPLGVPGFASAAVINLTITETELAGFVAVFAANVPWPGNSSINWSVTGQNLANSVITAVDSNGHIKIRGGVNPTHVVIDVLGYLL
jgi:hypothetical protein